MLHTLDITPHRNAHLSGLQGLRGLGAVPSDWDDSRLWTVTTPTQAEADQAVALGRAGTIVSDILPSLAIGQPPTTALVQIGADYYVIRAAAMAGSGIPPANSGGYQVWKRSRKTTTAAPPKPPTPATDEDCPPPENCVERWVERTIYVSTKPSSGAIEIPVSFEKIVCEGEADQAPEIDCDELLMALQASVEQQGGMNGLAGPRRRRRGMGFIGTPVPTSPVTNNDASITDTSFNNREDFIMGGGVTPPPPAGNVPPDWCKNCERRLVKATAYVTETQTPGSQPFKVRVKVLVCETTANPKIDCAEVVEALQRGLKGRALGGATRPMNGLRGLAGLAGLANASTTGPVTTPPILPPIATPSQSTTMAGMPWWLLAVAGIGVGYAILKK